MSLGAVLGPQQYCLELHERNLASQCCLGLEKSCQEFQERCLSLRSGAQSFGKVAWSFKDESQEQMSGASETLPIYCLQVHEDESKL